MPEIAMNYQPHPPPKTFNFPESIYGAQKRSFQHHWFENYPCLDYDEEDSVTSLSCKRQNSKRIFREMLGGNLSQNRLQKLEKSH